MIWPLHTSQSHLLLKNLQDCKETLWIYIMKMRIIIIMQRKFCCWKLNKLQKATFFPDASGSLYFLSLLFFSNYFGCFFMNEYIPLPDWIHFLEKQRQVLGMTAANTPTPTLQHPTPSPYPSLSPIPSPPVPSPVPSLSAIVTPGPGPMVCRGPTVSCVHARPGPRGRGV